MELIKAKLKVIENAWEYYFRKYKFCQDRVAYTKDVATNYFFDITSYFDDTIALVSGKMIVNHHEHALSNAIVLLQSIFVQQDLMDELLYIFKLAESTELHKKKNRDLRNQLVGHPISKDSDGLKSTVLIRYDNPGSDISYVLYERKNEFSGVRYNENIQAIIDEHQKYLHLNFDMLLDQINSVLKKYKIKLKTLLKKINEGNDDKLIVEQAFVYYESIDNEEYIYKKERLLEYEVRRNEHPRYASAVEQFKKELKEHLQYRIADIESYGEPVTEGPVADLEPIDEIIFETVTDETFAGIENRPFKKDISYELGKLHGKDWMVGVDYFIERFGSDPRMMAELTHMKDNLHNDTEYFAAYHYLVPMLEGVHSTMFYE